VEAEVVLKEAVVAGAVVEVEVVVVKI